MLMTNKEAAEYGLLAMFAMDMYRETGNLLPKLMPELTARNWVILDYIVGNDALFGEFKFAMTAERKYYGFLAQHPDKGIAVVLRGTASFIEWIKDAEFIPFLYAPRAELPGPPTGMKVEQGFWSLYNTMELVDADGASHGPLADAILRHAAVVADGKSIVVVGHSLGAALATYLTLDLKRGSLGGRVSACLFASPHTGNAPFVEYFDKTVQTYRLFNYILDMVPRLPKGTDYAPLPHRTVLYPGTAEASIKVGIACNHHVVCYCAMLDYENTTKAVTPPPPGEADSVACILGPEIGRPSWAKELLALLAGAVPV